jgi:hypothetical protein
VVHDTKYTYIHIHTHTYTYIHIHIHIHILLHPRPNHLLQQFSRHAANTQQSDPYVIWGGLGGLGG